MKTPIKFLFLIFIIFYMSEINSQVKTTILLDAVFTTKEPTSIFNYTFKYNNKKLNDGSLDIAYITK